MTPTVEDGSNAVWYAKVCVKITGQQGAGMEKDMLLGKRDAKYAKSSCGGKETTVHVAGCV